VTVGGVLLLVAAAYAAGVMNAMAGGGTILTFPALVVVGLPAIAANATSTVALLPGTVASFLGYRHELRDHVHWFRRLLVPSLIGGAIGSVLLLRTPERTFELLAPLLVLFATVLFVLQGLVARRLAARASGAAAGAAGAEFPGAARWTTAALLQLAVAVYGGYFGAGIGILMLALLGWLGVSNIHAANGLKNFFGFCINSVAAAWFVVQGAVVWPAALVVVVGATLGGYSGARFARRIGREKARAAVVVIGLLVTAILLWQRWG
jgi:uncharacterized membrane protein YfcA